jgi:hypothetical protein
MPPRKNKKKVDEDEEMDKVEKNSKWGSLLKQADEEED